MTARDASRPDPRPDARLVTLHAKRGDPHARLGAALAALEGADWGLTLAGETALARQLAALLGPGVLRVDERLGVDRAALAGQGLAAATLDADWTGARAVWLAEPDGRLLRRAARVGVPVIVDGTLAPGGGWFPQGAAYVVYRHGVTLTGFGETGLALLFGRGEAPVPVAPAPADVTVALALRDVATLPLRLARAARTVQLLSERLGGGALPFGPTALLLPPDAAADTPHLPGGVLAATRSVDGGVVLTPGLQDAETALALLRPGGTVPTDAPQPLVRDLEEEQELQGREEVQASPAPSPTPDREERSRPEHLPERPSFQPSRPARTDQPRTDQPRPDEPRPDQPRADFPRPNLPDSAGPDAAPGLVRVVFETPERPGEAHDRSPARPPEEAQEKTHEKTWTPEIVLSGALPEAPAPLPIPVSPGPDAPELEVTPPLAPAALPDAPEAHETNEPQPEEAQLGEVSFGDTPDDTPPAEAPSGNTPPAPGPAAPELTPDLPVSGDGAAADPTADLTDEQAAIFARLREWRNAEAKRQEVSRFIIASNATLAEIARRVPYTLEDLRAVRGMGPGRLEKYGEKILEVVRG